MHATCMENTQNPCTLHEIYMLHDADINGTCVWHVPRLMHVFTTCNLQVTLFYLIITYPCLYQLHDICPASWWLSPIDDKIQEEDNWDQNIIEQNPSQKNTFANHSYLLILKQGKFRENITKLFLKIIRHE